MTTAATSFQANPGPSAISPSGSLRGVDLFGPAGRLEALMKEGAPNAPYVALVCHPHPLGGGNLHNKVVYHAVKALNDAFWGLGWPTLRFNFRGTGLSQGSHDGTAEAGDVLAALDWLENEYKRPIVAVGFSFGAAMILEACCNPSSGNTSHTVKALVALGLPTFAEGRAYSYPFLSACNLPKFFISGDRDEYAPADQLMRLTDSSTDPKRLRLIPGADHFFTGQLEPMQATLAGWLKEQLL